MLTAPVPASSISDVDFHAETFVVQLSYSDDSSMDFTTLSITLKMDNGATQDITSYFSKTSETIIQSSNLYQFTRTLFALPSNDVTRTMTVTVSIKSLAGVTGGATSNFAVYPSGPAAPPDPPAA